MVDVPDQLEARAIEYVRARGKKLVRILGAGTDGSVWKTDGKTAVKSFYFEDNYRRELLCYQRLRLYDKTDICDAGAMFKL